MKSDMALGMAGNEQHLGLCVAEFEGLPLVKRDIDARNALAVRCRAHDLAASLLLDAEIAAAVIGVVVGIQHEIDSEVSCLRRGQNRSGFRRIDDGSLLA